MKTMRTLVLVATALCACPLPAATAGVDPAVDAGLVELQQAWAHANYEVPAGDARVQAFDALEQRADAFARQHPDRAEALIWQAIVESSHAGAKGGLGALALCKEAKQHLEAALELDPQALEGSAYTSLGTLYFKVPGFPLGFGNDEKAAKLLRKALEINPTGIDPNYFYAEYLVEQKRYRDALKYLDQAERAPARAGRETADKGRRAEIATLRTKVQSKLGRAA